jgi:hypothetical protein
VTGPLEVKLTARQKAGSLALSEFQKTTRFFRLYPPTHRFCEQSVRETLRRLQGWFDKEGELAVEIQREGVALDGEIVLRVSDQSTDLAFLLYPEGVRALTLAPGLEEAELIDLFAILAAQYGEGLGAGVSVSNDLLSALWRHEWKHVTYKVQDQLSAQAVRAIRDAALNAVASRIDELAEDLDAPVEDEAGDDESSGQLDREAFLAELDEARGGLELEASGQLTGDPARADERQAWLDEVRTPGHADPLGRALEAISFLQEEGRATSADVAHFLAGAILHALASADVEGAMGLLARAQMAEVEHGEGGAVLAAVVPRLTGVAAIQALARGVAGGPSRAAAGECYLSLLGAEAAPSACDVFCEAPDPDARRVLGEFLSAHLDAPGVAERLDQLVRGDDKDRAHEAAEILGRGAAGTPARALLEQAAGDLGDARAVLEEVSGEKERLLLVKVVRDHPDREERMTALARLRQQRLPKTYEDLADVARLPAFGNRDLDEIQAMLTALHDLGGLRLVRVLTDLAGRQTRLFGRRDTQKMREVAQAWLEQLKGRRG